MKIGSRTDARLHLIMALVAISFSSFSQSVNDRYTLYGSFIDDVTGKGIDDIYVSTSDNDASAAVSREGGRFRLTFSTKKAGEDVTINLTNTKNYRLVNLERATFQLPPIKRNSMQFSMMTIIEFRQREAASSERLTFEIYKDLNAKIKKAEEQRNYFQSQAEEYQFREKKLIATIDSIQVKEVSETMAKAVSAIDPKNLTPLEQEILDAYKARDVKRLAGLLNVELPSNCNCQNKPNQLGSRYIQFLASDSLFYIMFRPSFQFRYSGVFSDKYRNSFTLPRMRIQMSGYLYNPKLTFFLQLGFSEIDTRVEPNADNNDFKGNVMDAILRYRVNRAWSLSIGQQKLPGSRERMISFRSLQFIDRSPIDSLLSIDRDLGFQSRWGGKFASLYLAVSEGNGRTTLRKSSGLSYTGRVELRPLGQFLDFLQPDLDREFLPRLSIGAAYSLNRNAIRQGGQLGDFVLDTLNNVVASNFETLFFDVVFKWRGLSINSDYIKRRVLNTIDNNRLLNGLRTGRGLNAQAGYLIRKNIEFAFRYSQLTPLDIQSSLVAIRYYTFGVNKYLRGNDLKVQTDLTFTDNDSDNRTNFQIRFQASLTL